RRGRQKIPATASGLRPSRYVCSRNLCHRMLAQTARTLSPTPQTCRPSPREPNQTAQALLQILQTGGRSPQICGSSPCEPNQTAQTLSRACPGESLLAFSATFIMLVWLLPRNGSALSLLNARKSIH